MEGSAGAKSPRDPQRIVMAIVVAAIVIFSGIIAYAWYSNQPSHGASSSAIKIGDTVKMNYTGRFPFPDGRVFDTSILSVAWDDVQYPKSLTFSKRANDSYTPFEMTAGKYGSGGTIKGFAMGVIGLHEGDHQFITVAAADAYPASPSMIETHELEQKVPGTELMSSAEFTSRYQRDPVVLSVFPHFFWGWNVTVLDVSAGVVTIRHQPTIGQTVYPFGNPNNVDLPSGWPVVVESYDPTADGGSGQVTIRHMLTASDVYYVKGTGSDGATFIVSGFNEANGTFQLHMSDSTAGYNGEISGRALVFEVWIVKVTPA